MTVIVARSCKHHFADVIPLSSSIVLGRCDLACSCFLIWSIKDGYLECGDSVGAYQRCKKMAEENNYLSKKSPDVCSILSEYEKKSFAVP